MTFLFAGVVAGAATSSACFECSYGSFLRMRTQGTFDAILATPVSVADLAGGEIVWAATKGVISAGATLLVGTAFGVFYPGWWTLPVLAVVGLQGLFFAGISLAVAGRVSGFEGLNHFYALFIMPVLFLSGVFFPLSGLPEPLRWLAAANPLTHTVHLVRPLVSGTVPPGWPLEVLWIGLAGLLGTALGVVSLRRRIIV
jgi:lipooligosaccharide transport system permease protein